MKTHSLLRKRGFTLIETVIAIGVLAVLLTGFIIVFAPAAAGIKKSINLQAADRLASTLELELVTLRKGSESTDITTGFDKAFEWIKNSNAEDPNAGDPEMALLVYQYRGSLTERRTEDNTPKPVAKITDQVAGKDYIVQSMVRRKSDAKFLDDDDKTFLDDLPAIEGGVYLVKCTQLGFEKEPALVMGVPGKIVDPKPAKDPEPYLPMKDRLDLAINDYPEAVIAFKADFYALPAKSAGYFGDPFKGFYKNAKKPVFTRNLAVRR